MRMDTDSLDLNCVIYRASGVPAAEPLFCVVFSSTSSIRLNLILGLFVIALFVICYFVLSHVAHS